PGSEVTQLIEQYDRASAARSPSEANQEAIFGQAVCSIFQNSRAGAPPVYVFYPLREGPEQAPFGFAGMALDQSFIEREFLPGLISESPGGANRGPDSELTLAVLDENNKRVYSNNDARNSYEVKTAFAPVFTKWQLAAGYGGTTIEALASDNFRKSLILTFSVLLVLMLGIGLILRATAREMRLAETKSAFVANVSHELKTPLALIRLFAETLELGRVESEQKAEEDYRIISNESRRLTQLIDNLLDFSKTEAGRKEYHFVEASLAQIVEDVLKTYRYQLVSSGFELSLEVERGLPPASVDRDALSQALLNLLDNAVKYSGEEKKIAVRVQQRGPDIALEVADRGIGIPRSEHRKIFEKFYRVGTGLVHNTKGSGLGLAVVKHIVEAHGGHVLVESRPGSGSRFTLLIPALKPLIECQKADTRIRE